jgi:hypothetical protein
MLVYFDSVDKSPQKSARLSGKRISNSAIDAELAGKGHGTDGKSTAPAQASGK